MIETNEAKGFRHVRPERTGHEEAGKSGSEWEKKLDLFWQGRLNGQDPLEVIAAKENIDAPLDMIPWNLKIKEKGQPGHGSRLYDDSAMENLMKSVEVALNSEVVSVNPVDVKAGVPTHDVSLAFHHNIVNFLQCDLIEYICKNH
ncbi:hypothetical protein MtrunA17_Chr8g0368211 [Medicago truncatula]|uniref:Uncharacterized protein n=1 Tax=Medicago truncatula TaxID=3880 RepID=A0A396GN62_MEDTR|nr:hypothetical protein MtrunA17_Chr8g0368211 [Medicago truncatula]